jgi:hypothetical protein
MADGEPRARSDDPDCVFIKHRFMTAIGNQDSGLGGKYTS